MAFQRIDLLPSYSHSERNAARERWGTDDGIQLSEKVHQMIRDGGGEDFLEGEFEAGRLGFIEDRWDLRGLSLFQEHIEFPEDDNFENIDFTYGDFYHCIFIGACFPQTHFGFTNFYNVEFSNCLFAFAHFYGARLEKCKFINCDFVEHNGFTNCSFSETAFQDCFFDSNKFFDCKFDGAVVFKNSSSRYRLLLKARRFNTSIGSISAIYQGIKDAYAAGEVWRQVRRYRFLQYKANTRHDIRGTEKLSAYTWEYIAGYGLRPLRVLISLGSLYLAAYLWFSYLLGEWDKSAILVAGALFTFGANTELLNGMSIINHIFYIFLSFLGISLSALFVTVMANVLLQDR
jgi:hypothetical protein